PTNDLDVITLAALEEALLEFEGTVLVATHDRWFLDRVATSILAFERDADGEPRVVQVQGGYQRYLAYREARARESARAAGESAAPVKAGPPVAAAAPAKPKTAPRGLKYGEKLELEGLMERVEAAERAVEA